MSALGDDAALPARYRRLGVDVGDVRVGLAESDLDGLLATPVRTLERATAARDIALLVSEEGARVIMVGLPRSLNGQEGAAAGKARRFCAELSSALQGQAEPVLIRLVDERLTTVTAHQALHASGRKGRRHRSVVDQVAAVMILQQALDLERATGSLPGQEWTQDADDPSVGGAPEQQETDA